MKISPELSSILRILVIFCVASLSAAANAQQVNSGSDGHDGAFNPTQNVVIDMADHPDGIYQYTSVNIPAGVYVYFKPNPKSTPVVWLVQQSCVINGTIVLSGSDNSSEGLGGPGGYRGGNAGSATAGAGLGPGGGTPGAWGGNASFATLGDTSAFSQAAAGQAYGNDFLIPLFGGSGGGGSTFGGYYRGGGGGGAILIAASQALTMNGYITAIGGNAEAYNTSSPTPPFSGGGGAGSGGAVRFIATTINGTGGISVLGGSVRYGYGWGGNAGNGRIRFDAFELNFNGSTYGNCTQGFQPIILPASGQGIQLNIASVGGVAAPPIPGGVLVNPDVIIPAQQNNPIPVIVNCTNIPLNTEIIVVVHPSNGADVQAVGTNNVGTTASSTATVGFNMPRGGGIIYGRCVSGVAGLAANASAKELNSKSLAETGWTAGGERFAKIEITASFGRGGKQQIAYITESGKRFPLR